MAMGAGASADTSAGARTGGPVRPSVAARTTLVPLAAARITGGFWAARRRTNALTSIASGPTKLEEAGNLANLRRAAAAGGGGADDGDGGFSGDFQFQDSDVYKWLEAACWQLGDPENAPEGLAGQVDEIIELIRRAQAPDGYLQTYYQLGSTPRWTELGWGHELYCAGHLIQAAVAHHRVTGRDTLLDVARRLAAHIDATFGVGLDKQVDGVCGHPEIETALVELYRETGEPRHLALAAYFIDRRGAGTLSAGADRGHDRDPGPGYWQDHLPVRETTAVTGHAVRQLYLLAGVADVAAETGDAALHEATLRLWREMADTKTYVTGGVGSRYDWEAFGDPYELPSDRAYTETCAAIAGIQFSWRLALATGDARYSDLVERTLYNGFLSGVGLHGDQWLYVNPLHVREAYSFREGDQTARRTPWFRCACCPPNAMRLLASLPHYVASGSADGIQLHQYATGVYEHGDTELAVETDYPWDGRVTVTVRRAPEVEREIALRIPAWCGEFSVKGEQAKAENGWLRLRRVWQEGEAVRLELKVEPRLTRPHPKVDAVRGCVAIEHGPLVYCLESADQAEGIDLDELALDVHAPLETRRDDELLGGVVVVRTTAEGLMGDSDGGDAVEVTAIPYAVWANREPGAMRVWLPVKSVSKA